jgi:hypothetical protein
MTSCVQVAGVFSGKVAIVFIRSAKQFDEAHHHILMNFLENDSNSN